MRVQYRPMWFVLFSSVALASNPWFHPGEGSETLELVNGRVGGTPAQRTGALLVHVADPERIVHEPFVGSYRVLRGTGRVVRIVPAPGVDEFELSRRLRERADVKWAHPDLLLPMVLTALPDDPLVADQWHLSNTGQEGFLPGTDVNAEEAWAYTAGAGMIIAVLDSGVHPFHPDLSLIPNESVGDWIPDEPHGTAVAGLAAAIGNNGEGVAGVAYEADVYGIPLLADDAGMLGISTTEEAFIDAVDAGAAVINNSWSWGEDCDPVALYGAFADALDYAEEKGRDGKGTAVVFSAGNSNCDFTDKAYLGHEAVIAVGAVTGDDRKESYSSYGSLLDLMAPSGELITTDLVGGPGYRAYQGDNNYTGEMGGTSASAPLVSGVLALMFAANERLTAAQARQILCDTAVRNDPAGGEYNEEGWSPWYGCGRVDAGAAVRAVFNVAPEAPRVWAPGRNVPWDSVVLKWTEASDGDGDPVSYKVRWWLTDKPNKATTEDVDGLSLTLAVPTHVDVTWRVKAMDLWGSGEWSEEYTFTVTDLAEAPPSGCATSVAPKSVLPLCGVWLAMVVGWRRRVSSGTPDGEPDRNAAR